MDLAVITDEIDADLEHALDVMVEYGVRGVELRQVWDTHIIDASEDQKALARSLIVDRGMVVAAIASPFYKCDLPGETENVPGGSLHSASALGLGDQIDLLQRAFNTARYFDTTLVRIFNFWKRHPLSPEIEDQIVDLLSEPVALAEEAGMILGLENEHACYAGTGAQVSRIAERISSPALRIIWDPGNAYFDGERPFPDGYNEVRAFVAHVHVKDACVSAESGRPEWTVIGKGEIDWKGQITALKDSGYSGYLSLETHYSGAGSKEANSRLCLKGLQELITGASAS